MQTVRKCAICGNEFIAKRHDSTCCGIACYRKTYSKSSSETKKSERLRDKKAFENVKIKRTYRKSIYTLDEVEAMAREKGMHYGAYVAKYGV